MGGNNKQKDHDGDDGLDDESTQDDVVRSSKDYPKE